MRVEAKLGNWHEVAISMYKTGINKSTIAKTILNHVGVYTKQEYRSFYKALANYVDDHKNDVQISIEEFTKIPEPKNPFIEENHVAIQNLVPKTHDRIWNGNKTIKFGLMGDTQLASKYAQITYLHDFYDLCYNEGITDIYHTGDILDGLKMRPGHEYELYAVSADDQVDAVIKQYPHLPGITTHFITGNHDSSVYKQCGYDIGKMIDYRCPDMDYLGRDAAVVNLTPNCTMELRHPWDGTAYSLSYKVQKMVEAMEADSKPNILAVGHYHKAEYLFYRNVHVFQTGCFQGQTPFTRGKGISVHMGGWIIEIEVDENGYIRRIKPEFIPYYTSIKEDYKKY